ncbi:MAG: HEAT repeat domain-containing protein, partial [Spirochaetota bacterium]|nr:HEAT repeat domain-containing protein [Spirochaetota bacterium]
MKQIEKNSKDFFPHKIDDIKVLANQKDKNAIDTLVSFLGDPSHLVAKEAINALIELGEPVIPHVIKVLSDKNDQTRHFASLVLNSLGSRYMESVTSYIHHKDNSVTEKSVLAIKEIIRNTIKPLVEGLTQSGNHSRLRSLAILK